MNDQDSQFIRPLGMSERFYWIFDTFACTNFAIIAEVVGELSISALKNAFAKAVVHHPAYRLRVVAGPGHRLDYYAVSAQEALDGLDITVVENGVLDDVVVDEIDAPFPPGACPMVRCRILANVPIGRTTIVFTLHHCMTDAMGAMTLIKNLLLDSLNPDRGGFSTRPKSMGAETYTANQESLYPARYRGWRKPLSLVGLLGATGVDGLRGLGRSSMYRGQRSRRGRTVKLVEFALGRESSEVTLGTCRREGVTVNGLICAGLLLALRNEMSLEVLADKGEGLAATVVSAVNMRRWLADRMVPDFVPGMFASMMPTHHVMSPETTPWTLARDINQGLAAARNRGAAHLLWQAMPPARLLPPNEKGARRIYKIAASGPKGPIVTNIGRIEPMFEPENERVTALSFAIGPGVNFPICVAVSSWAGRLFINCTYDQAVFEAAFMARVMVRMKDYLTINVALNSGLGPDGP